MTLTSGCLAGQLRRVPTKAPNDLKIFLRFAASTTSRQVNGQANNHDLKQCGYAKPSCNDCMARYSILYKNACICAKRTGLVGLKLR